MTTTRVWAPKPASVEVETHGRRVRLERDREGWWSAEVGAGPGDDYAFVLDGADAVVPDPRSRSQPAGVHGPSRLDDPAAFRWTDAGFRAPPLARAVIYELHVGTFSEAGTFDGVVAHLDHLVDLGVTHVELMPVVEFAGDRGWGYDGVDLYAPHHAYGGPDGLRRLVDAAHGRGLAVLLDVVYNHLGPEGNYVDRFGPYHTDRYVAPWGSPMNFDGPGSDEVRAWVVDNALMWLRNYHVDGLRLDAVHSIVDTSAVHILEELHEAVAALEAEVDRPLVVIAESDLNDPRLVRPVELGGYGLDAAWSDDFHHALHALLTGDRFGYYADFGRLADVAAALRHAHVYAGRRSAFRGRRHGRPIGSLAGDRFVVCSQNHDQVGNRLRGERTSALLSPGRLRIAAALVLTSPFVPLLFEGEEWAASSPFLYFTSHTDPSLGEAVRAGRRAEFERLWGAPEEMADPQAPATFERSKLRWSELRERPHRAILDWYRSLTALRRSTPDLLDPRLDRVDVTFDEPAGWLVETRGAATIALNIGARDASLPIAESAAIRLASDEAIAVTGGTITLPPDSVAVLVSA